MGPVSRLALRITTLLLLLPPAAGAVAIPLVESACGGPQHDWRCFGFAAPATLATTFGQPEIAFTIVPLLPEDPENWRLISVGAGFNGNLAYTLVYASPGPTGSAWLEEARFSDALGRTFLSASLLLPDAFCREPSTGPYAGKWVCSEGSSLFEVASFGEIGDYDPVDPHLPSLAGPIDIHVRFAVFGSEAPEASSLNLSGAFFGYVFERNPVPEPGSGLLLLTGLLGLGGWRRRCAASRGRGSRRNAAGRGAHRAA